MQILSERERYVTPEQARLLLNLIAERMSIDDRDELARKRWANKVRQHWPFDTYSGGLETSIGEALESKGWDGLAKSRTS